MSQADRNQPKRGTASESRYTIFEFEKQFPDDAACLAYLMEQRYPSGVLCPKCQARDIGWMTDSTERNRGHVLLRPLFECLPDGVEHWVKNSP